MIILGVDPGKTGGLAIVDSAAMKILGGCRMPTYKHRGKDIVSGNGVMAFVSGFQIDVAVIEQVHAMPKQGVSSAFSFGRVTGAIEAVAGLITDKLEWVTPVVWKKHFKLSKDKQASIDAAKTMFGDSYHWKFKADDGIAEAALMARWWLDKIDKSK